MPKYFLISLANRSNLDLCLQYALAGFTNSSNGLWTYLEIEDGDFISFLYGAEAWNLYKVRAKKALNNAASLPPWPPVTFRSSGQTYYFPFRLELEQVRSLQESLVRWEFTYVAKNLLLRGGYRKSHFQADQTTLQNVSQLGRPYLGESEKLLDYAERFVPLITFDRSQAKPPEVYSFSETILQALIKRHLRQPGRIESLFAELGLDDLGSGPFEVLGEVALAEGQVDAIIKEATPMGVNWRIAIEVKTRTASTADVDQLAQYVSVMDTECRGGILIASKASTRTISHARQRGLHLLVYDFDLSMNDRALSFPQLLSGFSLTTR